MILSRLLSQDKTKFLATNLTNLRKGNTKLHSIGSARKSSMLCCFRLVNKTVMLSVVNETRGETKSKRGNPFWGGRNSN